MVDLPAFLADKEFQLCRMDSDHYADFFDCGRDEKMSRWFRDKAFEASSWQWGNALNQAFLAQCLGKFALDRSEFAS